MPIGTAWPDVGRAVGEIVATVGGRRCRVLLDRHRRVDRRQQGAGVRAALCADAETATARAAGTTPTCSPLDGQHDPDDGRAIVDAFLAGTPDDDERPNFSRLELTDLRRPVGRPWPAARSASRRRSAASSRASGRGRGRPWRS